MPLYVPHLAKKLGYLYRRHAEVNTHERFARHLGISPNNISMWINGNEVRAPELVPNTHIKKICDLFDVRVQWLEVESIEEFKALMSASISGQGPWQTLVAQAVDTDALQLIPRDPSGCIFPGTRGLVPDDESRTLERFRVGERLYISVNLHGEWAERASLGDAYAILVSVDPEKTTCLCPSPVAPDPHLTAAIFCIPFQAPERQLKVSGPTGEQSVVALFTTKAFPTDVYFGLREEGNVALLDRMATNVSTLSRTEWHIVKKTYEVI